MCVRVCVCVRPPAGCSSVPLGAHGVTSALIATASRIRVAAACHSPGVLWAPHSLTICVWGWGLGELRSKCGRRMQRSVVQRDACGCRICRCCSHSMKAVSASNARTPPPPVPHFRSESIRFQRPRVLKSGLRDSLVGDYVATRGPSLVTWVHSSPHTVSVWGPVGYRIDQGFLKMCKSPPPPKRN